MEDRLTRALLAEDDGDDGADSIVGIDGAGDRAAAS